MNNTFLYVAVALVVAAGGYGYYSYSQRGASLGENTQLSGEMAEGGFSLRQLLAAGEPQKCTFTDSTDVADTSGTVFVANGKMKGEFDAVTKIDGGTQKAYMVVDGETVYSWTSVYPQGVKTNISSSVSGDSSQKSAVDYDKKVDYHCEPWTPDMSVFELPSTVTFMEFNQPATGASASGSAAAGTTVTPSPANACAACDSLPNAQAKQQCRAALNCQ